MAVFCVCRLVFCFVIFSLFSRMTSCVFLFDIARNISRTNKQEKKNSKKTSYASLNFIRIPRVVISPSVTTLLRREKDSKQSDEIQATATQAVAM